MQDIFGFWAAQTAAEQTRPGTGQDAVGQTVPGSITKNWAAEDRVLPIVVGSFRLVSVYPKYRNSLFDIKAKQL
jgi:hypothetical protein